MNTEQFESTMRAQQLGLMLDMGQKQGGQSHLIFKRI